MARLIPKTYHAHRHGFHRKPARQRSRVTAAEIDALLDKLDGWIGSATAQRCVERNNAVEIYLASVMLPTEGSC